MVEKTESVKALSPKKLDAVLTLTNRKDTINEKIAALQERRKQLDKRIELHLNGEALEVVLRRARERLEESARKVDETLEALKG